VLPPRARIGYISSYTVVGCCGPGGIAQPGFDSKDAHLVPNYDLTTMGRLFSSLISLVTAGAVIFAVGCGSSSRSSSAPTLTSIALTPKSASVGVQGTQQFEAQGTFSDNSTQDLTASASWTSLATNIATVNSSGLATGVAVGSTTITATSGGISGTASLAVTAASLVSIAVTPTNPSIAAGGTEQFTATGTYSDGSTQNLTNTATWSSSTSAVATISAAGLATGIAAGSTTITATSGSVSGTTSLMVTTASLVSVAVAPTNPSIPAGGTEQFTATGTYGDGSTQNLTDTATWSSSTSAVATISATGLAKGAGIGSSTITATVGSVAGSTTLSVTAATLASIAVTPVNATIPAGSPLQFDAVGTYSDGSTQDLTLTATWSSSSNGVATITSGGLAMGVAAGTSTIGAKLGGVTGSTNLTVSTATSNAVTAPDWLEFLGDGSEGAYSCSGSCNLQGEHWFSSFEVASGATVITSDVNNPIVIRSTGACTVEGSISNSPNNGAGGNTSGHGDFGAGGGGGGAGAATGQVGYDSVGDASIEIVLGGQPGNAPGGNGNSGDSPTIPQYRTLLGGGTFWPVGGSGGGQGGSSGGGGGAGGGAVILVCSSISFTGTVDVSGGAGGTSSANNTGAGGGGGGGYVIFSAVSYPANTGIINISGGSGGSCGSNTGCGTGGPGGSGWNVALTIPQ